MRGDAMARQVGSELLELEPPHDCSRPARGDDHDDDDAQYGYDDDDDDAWMMTLDMQADLIIFPARHPLCPCPIRHILSYLCCLQ